MQKEIQEVFLRNNTGIKSKSSIVDGFVIRISEFNELLDTISVVTATSDLSNTIIIGQRGAGKTTLLHRVKYAIGDSEMLADKYLPIIFTEEQYNLSDLTNLWEAIAVTLDDDYGGGNLAGKIDSFINGKGDFERESLECVINFLRQENKIALLFFENLNFFLKKLDPGEKIKFVKSLTSNEVPIRIIASSTTYNDGNIDFGDNLFDSFIKIQLDGLSKDECEKLLITIGRQYGDEEQIKNVISNHPGRVESLRRLTGGVPRTISYLFQIFLDNENGKAIKDLYLLIDTLSLVYKSELDQLSTQQQKVVDAIARGWDAISVKDIVKRTRLESKNVSTILAYLEKNQIVEKVPTPTKNFLYRIRERFMNIWYLMRFGRKHDQANVIWLVRFFDAWCDESELTKKAKSYLDNLKGGNYDESAAIDMGNTFLSCENIPAAVKEEIIKTRDSVLHKRLIKNKPSEASALKEIRSSLSAGDVNKALELLEQVDVKNLDFYLVATSVYLFAQEMNKALETASKARELDKTNPYAAVSLAFIYEFYFKDLDKAVEIYKECLTLPQPHPYAANRLGEIAFEREDYDTAIHYHKLAATKSFKRSLQDLGNIYIKLGKYHEAVSYLKDAVKAKLKGANTVLAEVFKKINKKKEVRAALIAAVEADEEDSNYNLGKFYLQQKKSEIDKAEEQFKLAVEKKNSKGYLGLARIALKSRDIEKAIQFYKKGVTHGNAVAAHQLGHIYSNKKDFPNSDKMFAKAIELGDTSVLGCWIQAMYRTHRADKKKFAIELLEKYKLSSGIDPLRFDLLYAKILIWDDNVGAALELLDGIAEELAELDVEDSENKTFARRAMSELVEVFILLIAKQEFKTVINLFEDKTKVDYKVILRPVYYLLMSEMKNEFPSEYLKAGMELSETIDELKKEVKNVKAGL